MDKVDEVDLMDGMDSMGEMIQPDATPKPDPHSVKALLLFHVVEFRQRRPGFELLQKSFRLRMALRRRMA